MYEAIIKIGRGNNIASKSSVKKMREEGRCGEDPGNKVHMLECLIKHCRIAKTKVFIKENISK